MSARFPPRPKGPTTLPTSTAILSGHPAEDPAASSSAVRTAPPSAGGTDSTLHSRGGAPFALQGGVAPSSSSLGLSIAAMDLSVPPPVIEVDDLSTTTTPSSAPTPDSPTSSSERANSTTSKSSASSNRAKRQRGELDSGYDGETLQDKVRAQFNLDVPGRRRQAGPRDYLSGPSDELVEHLPRPSPLSNANTALPSPAISSASVSDAEDAQTLDGDDGNLFFPGAGDDDDGSTAERLPLISDSTPSRPRPRAFTLSHSAFGSSGTFPSTARSGPLAPPTSRSRFKLFFLQLFANAASAGFLIFIIVWALSSRALEAARRYVTGSNADRHRRAWDTDQARELRRTERVTKDIRYYALRCGFDVVEQEVETKDGYLLKAFKVVCLKKEAKVHSDGRKGFPVLIQHGLFQSCGSFITSEERSLAFWLAEHGDYQVYLGNARGVFDMGHAWLKRSDPRFWDYNIKELALYDLPALVDHVRRDTGYDKIAFIGHSQGNATMFCSLAQGMVPELGDKLSLFIALAPAVYAGPLTTGFPFTALKNMRWKTWRRWFGLLDFIPLMRISYDWVPSRLFGLLGYQMFAFLFSWTDANWLLDRKAKMFCFMPSPVSSASIFWWTGYAGFSTRGCVLDDTADKWFDKRFPPLAIHHGGKDYLVLTEPLLERLRERETDVQLIRVQKMDDGEHCDFFWHVDAVELCFHSFLEDIERTRPRYPGERARRSNSPQPPAHAPLPSSSSNSKGARKGGGEGKARDVSKLERERPLEGEDAVQRWEGERRDVEVRATGEGY
ncbi:hypothetical protein JCM8208_004348 [Rhodotorula glutinis]